MTRRFVWFCVLFFCTLRAGAQGDAVSFNLSTSKSFSPTEQPSVHLYTHDVDALEFRIYRIADPVKFVENLRELHSFGPEASLLGKEQIDERTWLERFHDWKNELWETIRSFFRHQFSHEARHELRARQVNIRRRSRIVSEAEFAQIPILNQRQLVARWRQLVPATYVSDANDLPIQRLDAGLYLLEATDGRYKAYTLLMVTPLALVTRTTANHVLAFVVDRSTGVPVPGVQVDAGFGQKGAASATTGKDGIAELPLTGEHLSQDNFWVVGAKGSAIAVSTPGTWALGYTQAGKAAGYVFTERPVYRPGHTVHWKAILREREGNSLALPKAGRIHVALHDETDKTIFDQQLPISAAGDITGDFPLPKDASLGYYTLMIGDAPDTLTGSFHVEDYRKPEYRVQVNAQGKRVLQGQSIPVTIDSRYFFGEPVANAKVKYRVYHERHFWWGEEEDDDASSANGGEEADEAGGYAGNEEAEKTGKLDANGVLTLQVPTAPRGENGQHPDFDYTVEAGVTDAANREITGRGRFLATYSTFRVQIEPVSYAVRAGEPARFRVTTVDYDNKPVSTRVHVELLFRKYENGDTHTTTGGTVDVTTDTEGHATGQIAIGKPDTSSAGLRATATAVQPGTPNPDADSYLWIMGAGEMDFGDSSGQAQIVADKKSYAPGDIAHLSIVSETPGFDALVVAQGYAVSTRQVVHSDGRTLGFDLPITRESQPNITVSALFVKDSTLYQASKVLKVPPTQQQLQVQITPAKDVFQPQAAAVYDVLTRDYAGKPVSADLSFGVVDEAIYSLYPDSSGDMVRRLFPQRYVEAQVDSSLDFYFAGEAGQKSPMLAMRQARYRPQLAQVKPGNEAKPRVRKAFPDTAFWAPLVRTDAAGHARVSFTYPDSLTTWRATVHAITATSQAGSAISRVLVRKDVLVRMGTPRFMLKGDEISLPVIVHNYLPETKQVSVSLAVQGLETLAGATQSISVPSKGEATALWRLKAGQIGTAKLTATAVTDTESDALELSFPVQPAGVARSVAQSGTVRQDGTNASAQINFPSGTDPAAHSLRVEVSPSIAGSLFSALDYLTSFPYGCTEQTMSSFLPNVVVAETLKRLNAPSRIDPADLQAKMQAGLARLKDYQHEDGGWGWWKEDDSRVYMTAYVVGGLGQSAAYTPFNQEQRSMLTHGMEFLRANLEQHPRMRPELRAAVIYALAQAGDRNLSDALNKAWDGRTRLDAEALAMTGLAMQTVGDNRAAQAAEMLTSMAVREGGLSHWTGGYIPLLDANYTNDTEATAYALRLLAKSNPNHPLLDSAAQWLMLQRNEGFWWNTTEQTAMVLFGLTDFLAASHELDADFTAEVLVNGTSAGSRHFTSADVLSGQTLLIEVDAAHLGQANQVQVVRREGRGRMYWSVRGRFFSTDKGDFHSGSLALNLTRDYFRLQPEQKDGKIMYTLQTLGSTANIGDVIAVHEAISGSGERYLLLEEPIPAGTEFVTSEDSYPIEQRPGGWSDWFLRREFHDDHAAFFANDFSGRQDIFYLLKVVNPGSFQVSPARVEPMYQPGVQATSDAFRLDVPAPAAGGGAQ